MFKAEIKSNRDEDVCILIKVENHSFNYICDCGEAAGLTVKDCMHTNAIFISHTHIDHFVNFDTILRHQIGTGRKIVICGPKGIIKQIQNRIQSYCWNLIEENAISYEVREILDMNHIKSVTLRPPLWKQENEKTITDAKIFDEKDFYVQYEILDHKTDSIAYAFIGYDKIKIKISDGFRGGKWVAELKKAYETNNINAILEIEGKEYLAKNLFHMLQIQKGKKLGIIMDHAASPENHKKIENTFKRFDEVFIECFYKDEDRELAIKNNHSYASMSGQIMKQSEVTHSIPVHFSRKYENEQIEELLHQFEQAKKKD